MAEKTDSIQWLRTLAAVEIVVWHSDLATKHFSSFDFQKSVYEPLGGIGVELFFVLSGYVICLSAPRYRSGLAFMWNRFLRLAPLYWIFTALVLAVAWMNPKWTQSSLSSSSASILKSSFFFPQQGVPILAPGWSLEHEMLFYGIVAGCITVWGAAKLRGKGAVAVILLVLGGLGLNLGTGPVGQLWDYHLTSPYMLAFALGWLIRVAETETGARRTAVCALAGLSIVLVAMVPAGAGEQFVLHRIFASVLLFIAVYWFGKRYGPGGYIGAMLARIGDASYSVYLSHWFCLSVAGKLLGVLDPAESLDALFRVSAVVGSVVVGFLIYETLEDPMDRFLRRRSAPWVATAMVRMRHAAVRASVRLRSAGP